MFLIGTLMVNHVNPAGLLPLNLCAHTIIVILYTQGIGVALDSGNTNHLARTTRMWSNIDSEVLLLSFLPGLIFKDSFGLDVHLFRIGALQCFIFAFPVSTASHKPQAYRRCFSEWMVPHICNFLLALPMTVGVIGNIHDSSCSRLRSPIWLVSMPLQS